MKINISFHEEKYFFSRKKVFLFTKKRISFHENNLRKAVPLSCLLADNNG